ncbi:tetratricopeptide repeat protein [Rhodanobacter sp. Col0626]|uniref:tetratricopeptide repeat protein n=1 Tax=Rhodanobacter sp. Col0626 TaxID=3415679 RepID=UPI003CEE5099
MSILGSIFDGLLGYEKLMLLCGFILFVFALAAITVMIVQRRDFKMAMVLIIFAIVLMGFPGIQAIKFSQDTVELDRIRAQPAAPTDPAQKAQDQALLSSLEERAAGNPQLQAQVSDGYRAIGNVNKAYDLASSVLQNKPSAAVQQTLIPVLTAKLNQVQGATPPVPAAPTSPGAAGSVSATTPAPASTQATAAMPAPPPPSATPIAPAPTGSKRREIVEVANQLQAVSAPLPAASHIALANAYVRLGEPQKAQASIQQARRLNPRVQLNPALQRVLPPASQLVH